MEKNKVLVEENTGLKRQVREKEEVINEQFKIAGGIENIVMKMRDVWAGALSTESNHRLTTKQSCAPAGRTCDSVTEDEITLPGQHAADTVGIKDSS